MNFIRFLFASTSELPMILLFLLVGLRQLSRSKRYILMFYLKIRKRNPRKGNHENHKRPTRFRSEVHFHILALAKAYPIFD